MNRVEIKEEAKAKIKGNWWNILWPLIVIGVISSAFTGLTGNTISTNGENQVTTLRVVGSTLSTIITGILSAGYIKYLLTFVRTGKFKTDEIINTIKKKWVDVLIATILAAVIIGVGFCLLIVPGIIMALAYTFAIYLIIDKDVAGNESLKASREMMQGHKWDYFVFELSFIGWILLVPFTLGILLVWLIPYMEVASVLYYEKLKEIKK